MQNGKEKEKEREKVRLSLDVSAETNALLDELAKKIGGSKSDVLRKSIALMEVAIEEKERGNRLGIVDKDDRLIMKIVGV